MSNNINHDSYSRNKSLLPLNEECIFENVPLVVVKIKSGSMKMKPQSPASANSHNRSRCVSKSYVYPTLLRFWGTRNVRKGDELVSLDMLLIDEQPTVMQGSVSASHIPRLRNRFKRNRVIFTVSDDTDTEDFVSFDMEVARLTNIQASKAARIVGIGVDAQVDIELHRSLAEIEGAQVLEAVQPEVVAQGSDPKLIRLAMLETSYLHLMVYLPDGFFKFKSADRNERREVSRSAPKAHYAPWLDVWDRGLVVPASEEEQAASDENAPKKAHLEESNTRT
ncbi:hypothetical protein YC2023_116747 [Brassica napus]